MGQNPNRTPNEHPPPEIGSKMEVRQEKNKIKQENKKTIPTKKNLGSKKKKPKLETTREQTKREKERERERKRKKRKKNAPRLAAAHRHLINASLNEALALGGARGRAWDMGEVDQGSLHYLNIATCKWWCPFVLVLKKQHGSNGCKMYLLRSPVDVPPCPSLCPTASFLFSFKPSKTGYPIKDTPNGSCFHFYPFCNNHGSGRSEKENGLPTRDRGLPSLLKSILQTTPDISG